MCIASHASGYVRAREADAAELAQYRRAAPVDRFGLRYQGFWLGVVLAILVAWHSGFWVNPPDPPPVAPAADIYRPAP